MNDPTNEIDLSLITWHRTAERTIYPPPAVIPRSQVRRWGIENGMPYIPEGGHKAVFPWYLKSPQRMAWLIRPLQWLRRRWQGLTAWAIVGTATGYLYIKAFELLLQGY